MVDEAVREMVERYGVADLLHHTVLIVDDDVPNLAVLEAVLESEYRILPAGSGPEALELLAEAPVDVIVTDQRMPDMTGVELLERVRATHPDVAGVVLTGFTDSPAIMSAINRAQVFRFLTKPWEAADVQSAVEQATRHVYQRRAISALVGLLAARNDDLAAALHNLESAQQQVLHLERLGTMGRLASGVTHDLRNFLMGLSMLEEEVQATEVSQEFRETVSVGLAGIRNLMSTLETMNHFARSGEMGISRAPCQPETVVRDALTVMRMDTEFRKRDVVTRVGADLPEIQADRQKLVQVLVNLIRNAVQATERGRTIVVEAATAAAAGPACGGGGGIRFVVEDHGSGIPADQKVRLFQPFSSTKGAGGMGMGLYLARLVVESHGGRIACLDRAGGGTRFEIVLGGEGG